ncbi:MAG: rRNA ((1402)-2-O)-methyltransferase [Actinomycetota bacterium]
MPGSLAVVSTPIGNLDDLTVRAAAVLCEADLVLAEDTRHTGRLLAHIGSRAPQRSLHDHNEAERIAEVLERIEAGQRVALVSDAGTPGVSDPGHRMMRACVEAGVRIEPIPGPSALTAALVVSGLPMDRVAFDGFLPRRGAARRARLSELASEPRTIVLFVSPHRAAEDLDDLAAALGTDRRATLARELTKLHEEVVHATLGELAALVRDGVRGELAIVIAGAEDARVEVDLEGALAAVERLVEHGRSTRDAVAEVAVVTGASRRELYRLATRGRAARDAGATS